MVSNAQVARFLRDYSALLVVSGADRFKVKAYRRAAETLEGMSTDLGTFMASGHDLQELPGVGKAIGPTIQRIMQTGKMPELEKLSSKLEPGVAELASRPGLDPRIVSRVYKKLKIGTLAELQDRLESGDVREKLGARVEFQIRQGLAHRPRLLFKRAYAFALTVEAYLKSIPEVARVEMTGSLRRRQETIGDLNFLVTGQDTTTIFKKFQLFAGVESSEQLTSERMVYHLSSGFDVTLHWTPPATWGWYWILSTGSAGHLDELTEAGSSRRLKFTEAAMVRQHVDLREEATIYQGSGCRSSNPSYVKGAARSMRLDILSCPRWFGSLIFKAICTCIRPPVTA